MYNDVSYVAKQNVQGELPTNTEYWDALGISGADLTDYVKNTDYATESTGGVIKTYEDACFMLNGSGKPYTPSKTYAQYQNIGQSSFISKGTLENVIAGKDLTTKSYVDGLVGDISSTLDAINGEVI